MYTVLLTDGEFTGMIRALRLGFKDDGVRVVGLSENPDIAQQTMLDAFYPICSHDDPSYFPTLYDILVRENVDYIFPIVSEGLESIAEREHEILTKTGARLLSSPTEALLIANDKGNLYSFLLRSPELSPLCPEFHEAKNNAELFSGIDRIEASGKSACIKRRRGEDAGGFWRIDDTRNYRERLFYAPAERVLSRKMLTLLLDDGSEDTLPPYLVSEFLPGEEWDCDVLAYEGKTL